MVTSAQGLNGPSFYESSIATRDSTQEPFTLPAAGRRGRESSSMARFGALKGVGGTQAGRAEQILELVVTAVTVVADIVTLALSRSNPRENPPVRKPIQLPGVKLPPRPAGGQDIKGSPSGNGSAPVISRQLEAIRSDAGDISVRTADGYIVRADARSRSWSVTAPDGKTTRVVEGNRVKESDGGSWSLTGRGSFLFGANKLTVQMSSTKTGHLAPSAMTIYSGSERVTIGGLTTGAPTLEAVARDGLSHDDALHDGTTYLRGQTTRGESWSVAVDGARRVMRAK